MLLRGIFPCSLICIVVIVVVIGLPKSVLDAFPLPREAHEE